eukprot:TRINITY_DN17891_c0_g1_i1.p1 TRINITY_DN17891_c0_g1~~TRINITY_DN17891_c0_g1_i1.p1  ORF type:complete len:114 (+),score=8.19 TRINITY_DN17891_c0_g1_i1:56-397(+)
MGVFENSSNIQACIHVRMCVTKEWTSETQWHCNAVISICGTNLDCPRSCKVGLDSGGGGLVSCFCRQWGLKTAHHPCFSSFVIHFIWPLIDISYHLLMLVFRPHKVQGIIVVP